MATLNLVAVVILLFDEIICSTTLTLQIFTQIELMFPNSFTLSKQSLIKRIGVLQDQSDITIHISETRLRRILPRPHRVSNSHIVPSSISHTTRVTQTTNVGLNNAFTSASGTRRLRGSFTNILPKVSCLSLCSKLEYVI